MALQFLIFVGLGIYGASFLDRYVLSPGLAPMALWLWMLLLIPGIAIHEAGHYLAAKWKGMCVLHVQVLCLQVLPRRRGVRMRWRRMPKGLGYSGFVMAFCDPSLPRCPARIVMTAGGPGINLFCAALLAAVGAGLPEGSVSAWLFAFALANASIGLQNLVPSKGRMVSDGYRLIQLLAMRRSAESTPYTRLIEHSLFGATADQLPERDLNALEEQPAPMPFVALWYRVKAAQIRAAWSSVASLREQFEQMQAAYEPAQREALRELLQTLSIEIAFSEAMSARDPDYLPEEHEVARETWMSPHLGPRCLALRAALAGESVECTHQLRLSESFAENDVDISVRRGERLLRGYTVSCAASGTAQA
ncbi:site-2 protease family protein [Oleiagrimonas soli]|uniref:Peptidase M50 domain-containing protein n=1 Tax=Oleiagrimonas soli TaxID=1543381 RepID=A0A099CSB7_9GAMM|nr:site-2 protease family protein [Oleiagrimonas soli]KGI76674.1 hypothetical protein LF63_0113955 [Oleiagrimonas soli]MBB6185114.1 hypothetical protein [Oleiagrimonas soli]